MTKNDQERNNVSPKQRETTRIVTNLIKIERTKLEYFYSHPSYLPNLQLISSNFYLFRFLQNSLNGKKNDTLDVYEMHVSSFSKKDKVWDDIIKLLIR